MNKRKDLKKELKDYVMKRKKKIFWLQLANSVDALVLKFLIYMFFLSSLSCLFITGMNLLKDGNHHIMETKNLLNIISVMNS